MDTRPIGIFDSGVGGLTVLSEISKKLKKERLIYLGDTKNFPYGDKSKETIIKLARKCIKFLIKKNVKLVVIACGTATSQALEVLQQEFAIPIIGIIQPTILALKKKEKKQEIRIGVIATEGTIRSNQWEEQFTEKIPESKILNKACPLLAPMAEQGWTSNKVAKETIHEYLKSFKDKELDYLILGCTHYPLFRELIEKELGKTVKIVSTGETIAEYIDTYLQEQQLESDSVLKQAQYYLTDTECNFIKVAKQLVKENEIKIQKMNIE